MVKIARRSVGVVVVVTLAACGSSHAKVATTKISTSTTFRSAGTSTSSSLPVDAHDAVNQRASFRAGGGALRTVGNQYAGTWAPTGWSAQPTRRVLVALHGTGGFPELEWKDWRPFLDDGTWAMVALSYRHGQHYDPAQTTYGNIKTLVNDMLGACGTDTAVDLVGFSRGSANTFPITYLDRRDHGPIRGAIATSGAWSASDPLPPPLNTLADNPSAMDGVQMWGWCGEADIENGQSRCDQMTSAFAWVTQHGGTVSTQRRAPGLGHADFPKDPDGVRAALTWLASLPPR